MALTTKDFESLAEALLRAEQSRVPVPPFTDTHPDMTPEDAYRIQLAGLDRRLALGRKIVGYKVGLTSKGAQQMLGVDQPDYGFILDHMVIQDGSSCEMARLVQPRAEPEIAFMLARNLRGPGVTPEQVIEATEYVFPALEIVDSRIEAWRIKLQDTIADNASSAMVVAGGTHADPRQLDFLGEEVALELNGETIATAKGDAVLGHPANAVAWCANKLAEYDVTLEAGCFVMPGSFTPFTRVLAAGDEVKATFSTVGTISVRFV